MHDDAIATIFATPHVIVKLPICAVNIELGS